MSLTNGRWDLTALRELPIRHAGSGNSAFLPGFHQNSRDDQNGSRGVRKNHGGRLEKQAIHAPKHDSGEIEEQHCVGKITAALLVDFDDLRHEGERGAKAGNGAEDFDGLTNRYFQKNLLSSF